jgi:hypothetical protein
MNASTATHLLRTRNWATDTRPKYLWRMAELFVYGVEGLADDKIDALVTTLKTYPEVTTPKALRLLSDTAECINDNAAEAQLAASEM